MRRDHDLLQGHDEFTAREVSKWSMVEGKTFIFDKDRGMKPVTLSRE